MPNTHEHTPGVEEIEKEFDSLFSLCRREYVCETCDEKRNWFRAALTSHHQKYIEAVVRDILAETIEVEGITDYAVRVEHIKNVAARHGINSDTLKS